jgi:hypothetical protein
MARPRWFGPKHIGWGLQPVTPQGWVLSGIFVLVVIIAAVRGSGIGVIVATVVFLALVALTAEKPGGQRSRRA